MRVEERKKRAEVFWASFDALLPGSGKSKSHFAELIRYRPTEFSRMARESILPDADLVEIIANELGTTAASMLGFASGRADAQPSAVKAALYAKIATLTDDDAEVLSDVAEVYLRRHRKAQDIARFSRDLG